MCPSSVPKLVQVAIAVKTAWCGLQSRLARQGLCLIGTTTTDAHTAQLLLPALAGSRLAREQPLLCRQILGVRLLQTNKC